MRRWTRPIAPDRAGATAQGAKLIAFPKPFIPGYPWQILAWSSPPGAIGRGFVQRYFDNSLSYDSPQPKKSAGLKRAS